MVHSALRHYLSAELRSASCHRLFVPRHRRSMFGRWAFSVVGLMTWNLLPDRVRYQTRLFLQLPAWFRNFSQSTSVNIALDLALRLCAIWSHDWHWYWHWLAAIKFIVRMWLHTPQKSHITICFASNNPSEWLDMSISIVLNENIPTHCQFHCFSTTVVNKDENNSSV